MSRPRVLHVYKDYYPPVFGGVENTINLMARGTRDEFEVRVLVCAGSSGPGEEVIDGVQVVRVSEWGRALSAPFSARFPLVLRRLAAQSDLLHFHHPNPTGDIAYFLARTHKPAVMTYHSDVVRQKSFMWLYGPVQERMMRACRVIMPTSPNYIESSEWLSRHREKCRVVPLGIELERFRSTAEIARRAAEIRQQHTPPLVIFVGRLRYYKGLQYVVEAMRKIDATLLIVGTGPDRERLDGIAQTCGVAERIRFLGELSDEEVVAHLHASDLFCLPSHLRSEAFGLSQVEAMACGLPVVSAEIGTGVSFVNQNGVTGLVVEPQSPDALASAVNRILGDATFREKMAHAARERAWSLFSAQRMCEDLKRVYRDVLRGV